jgi:hypothetical protein
MGRGEGKLSIPKLQIPRIFFLSYAKRRLPVGGRRAASDRKRCALTRRERLTSAAFAAIDYYY